MAKGGRPPANLVAQRFEHEGISYVAFEWNAAPDLSSLTVSEREIATMIVAGASNAEIARVRNVAVRTVANQVASILKKLGASSRFDLIARRPKADP